MAVEVKQSVGRPLKALVPIRDWAVDVANWMVNWMEQNDKRASGRSIRSISVEVTKPNVVVIHAADSVQWALAGRGAGKFPLVNRIMQWIKDRGLPLIDITINSLAFLIGRKIAKHGTNPPKLRKQNIDLVITSKAKKYLDKSAQAFAQSISDRWMKGILKHPKFKKA